MRNILWILGLGALVWIGAHATAAIAPLTTAFRATGAKALGYRIDAWVEVKTPGSLSTLAEQTGKSMHLTGQWHRTENATYEKLSESQTVQGTLTALTVDELSTGSTFIVASQTSSRGFRGLSGAGAEFARALRGQGAVHTDISLEGALSGRLSARRQHQVIDQAMAAIGASSVHSIRTAGYVASSGRTPFIHTSDQLQGRPVNVQVALTYNAAAQRTQVYVGTPLITDPY